MALHELIPLIATISVFAQTVDSNCRFEFDRNSKFVSNPSDLRTNETLVCGLRESVITYFSNTRTEEITKDVGIDWNGARCYDNHTISFKHSEEHFMNTEKFWFNLNVNRPLANNYDVEKHYLVFQCIGFDPISFSFTGVLPSLGNKLISEYIPKTKRFMTTLYVPFESIKSGNYSFQLIDKPSIMQWFYVLIQTNETRFWNHQTSGNVRQQIQTYEDPQDGSKLIAPCKLNTFEIEGRFKLGIRVAVTQNFYLLRYIPWVSQELAVDNEDVIYDPVIGFIIKKDRLRKIIHSLRTIPQILRDIEEKTEIHCKLHKYRKLVPSLFVGVSSPVKLFFNKQFHLETVELNSFESNLHLSVTSLGSPEIKCSRSFSSQSYDRSQQQGYISNVFLLTTSEQGLLSKCTWKDSSCDWNSHWLEQGDSLSTTKNIARNKKFRIACRFSNFQACSFYNPYKSGLIRCATNGDEEFVTELYFTGLNSRLYLVREWKEISDKSIAAMKISLPDFDPQETQVLYSNDITTFACTGIYFLLLPGYIWSLKFKNGTETYDLNSFLVKNHPLDSQKLFIARGTVEAETTGTNVERVTLKLNSDLVEIRCNAFVRDAANKSIQTSFELNIKVKKPPEVLTAAGTRLTINPSESRPAINCRVRADPRPQIKWLFNEAELKLGVTTFPESNGTFRSELTFSNSTENKFIPGNYTCFANNTQGNTSEIFYVVSTDNIQSLAISSESSINAPYKWIAGILALGFVMCIPAVIFFTVRQNRKNILTKEDMDKFLYGEKSNPNDNATYTALPYNQNIEVDLKDFSIDPSAVLGSGFYGMVLKAKLNGSDVAAKTLKTNSDRSVLLVLLAEIKIMSYLEENPNIVSIVGAYTKELAKGRLYLFEEFCPLGSLESYLKTHKHLLLQDPTAGQIENSVLSLYHLRSWSFQIAQGMRYLSDCKVIHGDLAIRNLVLKDVNTIKITDFGLARQLHDYSIYKKTQDQPLPWRHMSPESLSANEFSVKSDVWAFGVTLWEMFSLGRVPYAGIQCAFGFAATLEEGLRLRKPPLCPSKTYSAMEKCWNLRPQERPDFHELCVNLMDILLASRNSEYLQISEL